MPQIPYSFETVPAKDLIAITPTDGAGNQWAFPIRGIYVGGAGNISVRTLAGNDVLLTGVVAGTILQIAALRVNATTGGATTATNLVGLV